MCRELFADRGYDHDRYRRQRGITARLHGFERPCTRYERRAHIHLGLLQLAGALSRYRQLAVVLR